MLAVCLMAVSLVLPIEKEFSKSYSRSFLKGSHSERVMNCLYISKWVSNTKSKDRVLLVLAIASVESGFLSAQKSKAGALGLLGVMPSNLKKVKKKDRTKKVLVLKAVEVLDAFIKLAKGDLCKALAKYNAGVAGSCSGKGGGYAKIVLDRWYRLCFAARMEELCSEC